MFVTVEVGLLDDDKVRETSWRLRTLCRYLFFVPFIILLVLCICTLGEETLFVVYYIFCFFVLFLFISIICWCCRCVR